MKVRWGFLTPARIVESLLLAFAAVFFALHYAHLNADFPSFTEWRDWSKYTDEGWYGSAAIRQVLSGHWFYPGDFNPAVALPVWPLLEFLLFRVAGVSAVAARALSVSVFGLTLVAVYLLLRGRRGERSLAPAIAVLLLAVNPFCYVFTRLAILEPLLVLLALLALFCAQRAGNAAAPHSRRWMYCLGVLLPLMVLTKTTAIFVMPAIFYMLWAVSGHRLRPFLRLALPVAGIAFALWGAYFLLLVRPHYLVDYHYLFSANAYTGITRDTALTVFAETVADGMWIGPLLYPLSIAAFFFAMLVERRLWRSPVVLGLSLWVSGYLAFVAYHDNLEPRYYLVIAVPLTMLVALSADLLLQRGRVVAAVTAVVLAVIVVPDASRTLHFVRTPEHSLHEAALGIQRVIQADPTHSRLLLSISGEEITLMTGIDSICDGFGTADLAQRVAAYRPGWYAAWNDVDDDKMDALSRLYRLERVAEFPAMDDPERNLLILYRLDPATEAPANPRARKPIPRRLQTPIGQQPSTNQLEH